MSTAPPALRRPPWYEARGIYLIGIAVGVFYLSGRRQAVFPRVSFAERGLDYYNLLVDGFLDGHLSLKYAGTPGIEKLSNPYDPAQNAPYRVLDMSYYRGKYYIYFGPTPALVLMLPWRVLTGFHLPSYLAGVIFCCGGYAAAVALLRRWRQRWFPELGAGPVWLAVLLLGTANMAPALLRRPEVYEVAISCGYCFVALAFYALDRAAFGARRPLAWLAAASAAYGLALVGRPTCLYGALLFPAVLLLWWRRRDPAAPPRAWQVAAAALVPLGTLFAGMLLYNYLRFGRPLEFGQIYQLTSRNMGEVKAFSLGYFRFDAWLYLLMPAQYSAYFPYFLNALPPPLPAGYDGIDDLYGILPNLPVLLGAAGLLVPARGPAGRRRGLGPAAALVGGWTVAVLGVFLFFSGATIRYYLDFLPGWLLLACVGLWSLLLAARPGARRAAVAAVLGAVALYSLAFAVAVSFQHAGLLRALNPAAYDFLAANCNVASAAYDRVAGTQYGPLEVQVRFPSDQRGRFQPLLVTGAFPHVDYLWVLYTDDGHLQLGYEHTNYGGAATPPIRVDYRKPHTLRVEAGMLYPPEAHPYFAGRAGAARQLSRLLRVSLDGVPYLDTQVERYDPVRPGVTFGRNDVTTTFGTRFTGEVLALARVAAAPGLDPTPRAGPVRLSVTWPEDRVGHREPLLVTGRTGAGDILYVEYLSATTVRFGVDHWGVGVVTSAPTTIVPGRLAVLDIAMDALNGPATAVSKGRVVVELDGREVMDARTDFHPAPLATQTFGVNLIGGSTAEANFSGRILAIHHPAPGTP